jgi:hypothetical protein
MSAEPLPRSRIIPGIVRIVLSQAMRRRADGTMPAGIFHGQIRRLEKEELNPRGFALMVRELRAGRTRFIIKDIATGDICDLLEFESNGAPEEDTADALARTLHSSSDGVKA